jgi:hypothetical protein
VRHLSLMGEWVGDDGLRALAAAPRPATLRSLRLWTRGHSPVALHSVILSPALAGLTALDLSWMATDSETAALLALPAVLPGLERLALGVVTPADREALARRFGGRLTVDEDE